MKTLYVLRHAKAVHFDTRYDDFDRPLEQIGRQTVAILQEQICKDSFQPELILCSSSRRTRETLDGIQGALPSFASITYDDTLYLASKQLLLSRIQSLDNGIDYAMLIGHNPGIEQLVAWLVGDSYDHLSHRPYPTAGLCHIQLNIDSWSSVDQSSGRIQAFLVCEDPL